MSGIGSLRRGVLNVVDCQKTRAETGGCDVACVVRRRVGEVLLMLREALWSGLLEQNCPTRATAVVVFCDVARVLRGRRKLSACREAMILL
jgi:hypothetical protein